jgi:hypothetical protein
MSFTSICRFYIKAKDQNKSKYILKKCNILKIHDNLLCTIEINDEKYNLYLKGVPKKKILKNYFKYLCENQNMYVRILKEDDNQVSNNILGGLYTSDKININILLINRFNYIKKKYIYERTVVNSFYKKKKKIYRGPYKPILSIIQEEVEDELQNNTYKITDL